MLFLQNLQTAVDPTVSKPKPKIEPPKDEQPPEQSKPEGEESKMEEDAKQNSNQNAPSAEDMDLD